MNNPTKTKLSTPAQARTLAAIRRRLANLDHRMNQPENTTWLEICELEGIPADLTLYELSAEQADRMIQAVNDALNFIHKIYV